MVNIITESSLKYDFRPQSMASKPTVTGLLVTTITGLSSIHIGLPVNGAAFI